MAEYIERELLKRAVHTSDLENREKMALLACVSSIPAADVALVRYGTWKRDMSSEWSSTWFFCSRCKRRVYVPLEANGPEKMYPYCNCGAKMDSGG